NPHIIPTLKPVVITLCFDLIFGVTNPVHPSSSTKPLKRPMIVTNSNKVILSPPGKPNIEATGLFPELNMPGRNTGENNERARSVVNTVTGAIKRAATYHLTRTRHLNKRE